MIGLSVVVWGTLIGVILGLLGGGGALISIPILLYAFHFSFSAAVGASLLLVSVGATPSLFLYWRKREVDWPAAWWMGGSGALGAWLGSVWSAWISPAFLLNLLIALVGLSAWKLFQPSGAPPPAQDPHPGEKTWTSSLWLSLAGFGIGVLTGLVGVGGGFLIVPALMTLRRLEPRRAIATSLAIIAFNAISGALGYGSRLPFDQPALYGLMAATFAGGVLGFRLSYRLSPMRLKQGFGLLLLIIAALLFFRPPSH